MCMVSWHAILCLSLYSTFSGLTSYLYLLTICNIPCMYAIILDVIVVVKQSFTYALQKCFSFLLDYLSLLSVFIKHAFVTEITLCCSL